MDESSEEEEEEDEEDEDEDMPPRRGGSYMKIKQEDGYLPSVPIPHNVTFWQLTDDQLATIDFKELMRLMRDAGMSEKQITEAKARRRRLKNRLSARVCSNKKREKCTELSEANSTLKSRITSLDTENRNLRSENQRLLEINAAMSKLNTEQGREIQSLKTQVQQLSMLLMQAGLLPNDAPAAFAA